jgi:hypothetical protein
LKRSLAKAKPASEQKNSTDSVVMLATKKLLASDSAK